MKSFIDNFAPIKAERTLFHIFSQVDFHRCVLTYLPTFLACLIKQRFPPTTYVTHVMRERVRERAAEGEGVSIVHDVCFSGRASLPVGICTVKLFLIYIFA